MTGAFAYIDQFRVAARVGEDFGVDEIIVDDHIAGADRFRGFEREQFRIARPCADQVNLPSRFGQFVYHQFKHWHKKQKTHHRREPIVGFFELQLSLKLVYESRYLVRLSWTSTKGSTRARPWRATTDA